MEKQAIAFHGKSTLCKCSWRAQSIPFGIQLYECWKLDCRTLYMQRLDDFIRERRKPRRKGQGGCLKLFDRNTLQKLVNVEHVQACIVKRGSRIAGELLVEQTHCLMHGPRALLSSLLHSLFCSYWALHPIERLSPGMG